MTPGRRLEPTLQKLERCAGETNPLGSAAKAFIALIQRKSNQSLENLAVAIGATMPNVHSVLASIPSLATVPVVSGFDQAM